MGWTRAGRAPVSRSSRTVRGTISSPMTSEATASARSHPVVAITTAATRTATDPRASLTTSRNAARMFMFVVPRPVEHREAGEVADQADHAEDDHRRRRHLGRREQPLHALDQDVDPDREQQRRLGRGAEDLRAAVAPGPLGRRRAAGQRGRDQAERQARDVGEHVRGVREQREAARDDRADDLDHQHRDGDRQDDGEPAAVVGETRGAVVVVVAHAGPPRASRPGRSAAAAA